MIFNRFLTILLSMLITLHCQANELKGESTRYPIIVRTVDIPNDQSLFDAPIEVCSKTNLSREMSCITYPTIDETILQSINFSWDYFLRRCNSFILNNRMIGGAKVMRSIMILAGGIVTGAISAPTLTFSGAASTTGFLTGVSGTSPFAAANLANITMTPSKVYPDYRIPTYPSDNDVHKAEIENRKTNSNRRHNPRVARTPRKDVSVKSGMARTAQFIAYLLKNEGKVKTLRDADILAFQNILHNCSDALIEEDFIVRHNQQCLGSCHQVSQ